MAKKYITTKIVEAVWEKCTYAQMGIEIITSNAKNHTMNMAVSWVVFLRSSTMPLTYHTSYKNTTDLSPSATWLINSMISL